MLQDSCKNGNGDIPATCHHKETFFDKVMKTPVPKVLLVPATGLIGFSREWKGIALHLGDKNRGIDPTIVLCEFRLWFI